MNIQGLNAVTILNAYSLSLQINITAAVKDTFFISVMNCALFFY